MGRKSKGKTLQSNTLSRRQFLANLGASAALPVLAACSSSGGAPANQNSNNGNNIPKPFLHSIASGDPLADRVILWTRVTTTNASETVSYQVSRTQDFASLVAQDTVITSASRDFTVKVDVVLPDPDTTYYYRFMALGVFSVVGRTKTLPVGAVSHVRMGLVSCSSLAHGFFNAYRHLATFGDLDVILHLGDYIYEYGSGEYGNVRPYEPTHEMISLSDYRTRHAQYKRDPDLQALHRQFPFITIWDDHESTNDSYRDGAENHTEGAEGVWVQRKSFAQQAYDEWMPIRTNATEGANRIFRSFTFGDLCHLMMLDTRLYGRGVQGAGIPVPPGTDLNRDLLGAVQHTWLDDQLTQATAQWKILGQQVMFGQLKVAGAPNALGTSQYLNADQWDGYQTSRNRVFNTIKTGNAGAAMDDVVVLTGDIHTSWAMDLSDDPNNPLVYNPTSGAGSLAVEFVVTSVTSPGLDALSTIQDGIMTQNPHIKYVDLAEKGFAILDIQPDGTQCDWYYVNSIAARGGSFRWGTGWRTETGNNRLTEATAPTAAKASTGVLAA